MPLFAEQIATNILGCGGASLSGPHFQRLALAVGQGVSAWAIIPTNISVLGVATGIMGSGVTQGSLSFTPNIPAFNAALSKFGGPTGLAAGTAVCVGLAASLNTTVRYQGVSAVIGVGVDVAKVVSANPVALQGTLTASFAGQGFAGPQGLFLAAELSVAIAALFLTGVGRGDGIVSGAGFGIPATGPTFSGIV